MIAIRFNGEPCASCGFAVQDLVVSAIYSRRGHNYRVNVSLPCGCVHAVTELTPDLIRREQQLTQVNA